MGACDDERSLRFSDDDDDDEVATTAGGGREPVSGGSSVGGAGGMPDVPFGDATIRFAHLNTGVGRWIFVCPGAVLTNSRF